MRHDDAPTYETILWEQDGGIGTITINRPEHFNGITNRMLRELHELLHDVAGDESVAVVVLTGAGRAFCPGADLKHYSSGQPDEPAGPSTSTSRCCCTRCHR